MSIKGFKIKDKVEKYDYESLENKPFYSEIKTEINRDIIPLQEVEGTGSDGMPEGYLLFLIDDDMFTPALLNVVDKGQYNLTIDETTEQITTTFNSDMGGLVFGNLSIIGLGDDTGESYIGIINFEYDDREEEFSSAFILALKTTESIHTIGLSHIGDVAPVIVEDTYSFEITEIIGGIAAHFFEGLWEPSFEEDSVYNLTFDGEVYEGLSWRHKEDDGMNYLGNLSILGLGDDTGEKYCLIREVPDFNGLTTLIMATSYEAGDYTVSLEKSLVKTIETVHKIDNKYLDVKVEVPYTEDGKGNVTFKGDVKTSNGTSLNAVSNRLNTTNNTLSTVQSNLNTTNNTLSTVQNSLNTTKSDLNTTKSDLNTTKNDLNTAKDDLNIVKDDLNIVKDDLNTTKNDLNTTKNDLNTTKNDLNTVKTDLEAHKLIQPDYLQNDSDAKDYIKNKPRIGQDYIVLTDIETGVDYGIHMANGTIVSYKVPARVEITTNPTKMEYFNNETFDPTGMVLTAYYGDGTSEIVEEYTCPTGVLEGHGNVKLMISTEIKKVPYEIPLTISVLYLDDFEYTINEDGTYTLTAWKGTLNGEPSTELIIPDSSRIKI